MTVSRNTIITRAGGEEIVEAIEDEKTGVPPEVRKWGEGLVVGRTEEGLLPEEALADLELVSLGGRGCGDDANGWVVGEYAEEWGEGWGADGLYVADLDCPGRRQFQVSICSFTILRVSFLDLGNVLTR